MNEKDLGHSEKTYQETSGALCPSPPPLPGIPRRDRAALCSRALTWEQNETRRAMLAPIVCSVACHATRACPQRPEEAPATSPKRRRFLGCNASTVDCRCSVVLGAWLHGRLGVRHNQPRS
jgi:hypothetical protein